MRKLKYLLFLLTFLLIIDVDASTVGGLQADSPTYAVISSNYNNVPVRLWTVNVFGESVVDYSTVVGKHVYVSACTDMPTLGYSYVPFYNSTTGGTASASDIRYSANLTNKSCLFNTGASGKVAYLKFRVISDILNVPQGSSNTTWFYNDYITLYIGTNRAFSFSIQNISFSDDDLDIYSSDFDTSILESQNQTIINQQNQNTNSIINNQDSNTQDIIDNQQQNTQDIIDNQNQNTQEQIESQKVCMTIDKNNIVLDGKRLVGDNSLYDDSDYGITDYINVFNKTLSYINVNNIDYQNRVCFYDSNKVFISCYSSTTDGNISIPNNAFYFRSTIYKVSNKPILSLCSDGNQALNDSVNDLNDTLNDETEPNTNSSLDGFNNSLASDTPITDLLTLPLTLINAYINGMNSSCSPYNFGSLLGTDLTFPCINLQQHLGSNIWNIIDVLFSIFMIFNISKLFIGAFNKITTLKDDFSTIYTNDYQPRHGGDE